MKNNKPLVIGVLGGMGTYATINFFRQYAKVFPAVKEWDRPRIIIDNNCTMPSRVRALLYNENVELLVDCMTDSIKNLIQMGATKIVLACNTSHLFLDQIYEKLPIAKNFVVNAIDNCAAELNRLGVKEIYLLASEGTILSRVYEKSMNGGGCSLRYPNESEFPIMRNFMEAVKQDNITADTENLFVDFVKSRNCENILLGCTEFPILYERCADKIHNVKAYDSLMMLLEKLNVEFKWGKL